MRKKMWIVLVVLMLNLLTGAVCTWAADDTQTGAVARVKYENHEWTQTYDTLDEAVEYATTRVGEEFGAMTVTLLRDVTLEQPINVDTCYIDVILELDGHTISGALDEALFQVSYLYGTEVFAIQNGTIRNSGNGAALLLDYGKTTVQNVNVIGDTELTGKFVDSSNYVPTFIGGGTFTQIRRSSGGNYNLPFDDSKSILAKGCYFVDPDGTRVSDQDRLQNVTVMSCQHKDENGQFTYVKGDNKGNYICTICGNLCPHEHRSDNVCQDCGLLIGVVREKREPQYFDSFDHAWTQDWSMKYTLVRDQTSTTVLWNNSMTIDLNGCIFVQSTEGAGNGSTSISDGVTTVQNSAAKEGHYQGEVVVGGLREGDGKLVIPAQNNNLTIDKLTVTTGRAELAGGTFGTITVADNKVCKDLLAAGYYYEKDGKPTGYGDETTLTQVTVKPCDHQSQMVMVGTDCMCPCGNVHFVAQVERAGVSTYYADFAAACAAANGDRAAVIRPLVNMDGQTVALRGDVTVELPDNSGFFAQASLELTGGTVTFQCSGSDSIGAVCVRSGGRMETAAVGLNVDSLTVEQGGEAALGAGSYGSVTVKGAAVSETDFTRLLVDKKAFRFGNSGSWVNEGDLADIEGGRQIAGVGVYDAPFGSLKITGNSTIQYAETGSAATLTADYETGTTMDEGKLTFAWYAVSADGTKTLIKNESGKSYVLPADLALGAYSYCVRVSCDGYVRESEPFGVTVGQRLLRLPVAADSKIKKTYDGTAAVDLQITGFKAEEKGTTVYPLEQGKDFEIDKVYYEDVNAGAVNVYFEITLKNDNYCFNDGNRTSSYLFGGEITKAAASTAKAGTLTIQNDCKADYTFDFKSLLPALATSKSYGTIEYQLDQVSLDGYYGSGATISDGVLYLPVKAYTGDTTGVAGTVTVTVITQNYENITLTLKIRASEKKLAVADGDVTVAQSTVTYGDRLHDIEIAGTMKDGSKTVKGTFVWQVSQQKLNAGTHQVGWKFVPDDTDAYLEVHGTVEVTVNKATPAGEPENTPVSEADKTIADVPLTCNEDWPTGVVRWVVSGTDDELSPTTKIEENQTYEWLFEPYDKINYNEVRGTLTPYSTSSGNDDHTGGDSGNTGGGGGGGGAIAPVDPGNEDDPGKEEKPGKVDAEKITILEKHYEKIVTRTVTSGISLRIGNVFMGSIQNVVRYLLVCYNAWYQMKG